MIFVTFIICCIASIYTKCMMNKILNEIKDNENRKYSENDS